MDFFVLAWKDEKHANPLCMITSGGGLDETHVQVVF